MKTSEPNASNTLQSRNTYGHKLARKLAILAGACFLLLMMSAIASAQVSVTATAGTLGPTPYTTVKLAFDAINAGTHQGAITIDITANTTEGATPATLNSSGAGPAVYTSVLIRPTADGVSISGNPITGFGVIQLKAADNVTIDGDNPNTGGTNRNLTINNTATATVIANSVIRIATAATVATSADNITIKNLILNGNVTAGNAAAITSTTGSSNSSFGIYVGGNGGTTATDAPTAITSVTANFAPTGTTINALLIDNNAVNQCARAIVYNGQTAGVSNGVTITNNLVGDQGTVGTSPPIAAPTTTVYTKGIWVAGTTAITMTGNSVKSILSFVGTTMNGIELNTAIGTGVVNVSNNTVNGVINNGTASAAQGIAVSSASAGATVTLGGNTVTNVQTLAGATVAGIQLSSSATSATIEKNKVSTVYTRGAGGFGAYGINLAAGNAVTVQNNFIWDINAVLNNSGISSTFGNHGIRVAAGLNHKIYHNSIYLSGAFLGSTTLSLSSAFTITSTTFTGMDVRNNIFANTMTGAGAFGTPVVSEFLPSGGTSAMNLTINNNDYLQGAGTGAAIAQVGTVAGTGVFLAANFDATMTTPATNLRSYTDTLKAATGNDNASKVVDPLFVSTTDLHIAVASPMVDAGASVGVTDDIDGQLRVSVPDIGADEPSGVTPPANDIAAIAIINPAPASGVVSGTVTSPQASFKNVGTATQTSVGVNFSITGPGGYAYSNPQVIASINPGQTLTVTFAAAPAFVTAGTYNTTATVTTADANATNDSVASTFTVFPAITGGTVNVGTGEAYTSLTNPTGIFDAINQSVVASNIVVNVTSDLSAETGAISLNQWTESGAGGYTLFIQPSGAARTISGSNTTVLINLNGADRTTFSGLAFGGQSLTIRQTNAASGSVIRYINDSSNNSILSCIIEQNNSNNTAVFYSTGTTTGNDNNAITGSIVRGTSSTIIPFNSMGSFGTSAAISNGNLIVSNNTLTDFGQAAAVMSTGTNDFTISGNDISQTASRLTQIVAISIGTTTGTNSISGNKIHGLTSNSASATLGILIGNSSNLTISSNRIYDFQTTAGATGVIEGMEYQGASGATPNLTVVNNFVSLAPTVTTAQAVLGIQDFGFGGNIFTANHNTCYIGGTASGASPSWAMKRGNAAPTTFTARNNLLFNNRTGGTSSHFAGGDDSANTGTFVSDFNFYAGTGSTPANFMDYGTSSSGTPVSPAAWQAGPPARDANSTFGLASSFTVSNIFVDQPNHDLHLKPTAGAGILSAGTTVATVTTDFDGDPRPAAPDRGADELVQATGGVIAGGTYYNVSAAGGDSLGGNVTITNVLYLNGILNTGANTLTIGCNATVSGASPTSYVDGNLKKTFCGFGVKGFEVGTANGYSPVSVNFTAGPFPADFTVKAVQGPHPAFVSPQYALQRYWTLTATAGLTADLTFNYLDPTDIPVTAIESRFVIFKYNGVFSTPGGTVSPGTDSATITGVTSFSDWTLGQPNSPTAAPATISGSITNASGAPLAGVPVFLGGGRTSRAITDASGTYRFPNLEIESFYTVTPAIVNYHFSPPSRSFSLLGNRTDATFTGIPDDVMSGNFIDTPEYFVRQHYLDFLNREPDSAGLNFWSDQIVGCGNDFNCVERRTINVSAAYFLSIEFRKTGHLVDSLYRASFGRAPLFNEFLPDTSRIGRDVIVGQTGWEGQYATNKQEFLDAWVERAAFRAAFDGLANDGYVDALISHTGVTFTDTERATLVNGLNAGSLTRANVLEQVAENERFVAAKFNETFVRMQYFGYLRRDPDDSGFHFWLNKLNEFEGNFERAEMVKAFLVSGEYRDRFRP